MLAWVGCSDEIDQFATLADAPDMTGEPVSFATGMRTERHATRAYFTDEQAMGEELKKFHYVTDKYNDETYLYTFDISMYRQSDGAFVDRANYQLAYDTETNTYDAEGTLALKYEDGNQALFWPDNSSAYGFRVEAGNKELGVTQNDASTFMDNDLLLGYGFEPLWDGENDQSTDDIDALNYRTSREWYAANKLRLSNNGSESDYRKIPLYLKHQRCWVTIKLKAGGGVLRNLLTYDATEEGFASTIYSYGDGGNKAIDAWRRAARVDYAADKNGPAVSLEQLESKGEFNTITLNAIVEPQNYLDNTDNPITEFVIHNSKYVFSPQNDANYSVWNQHKDATQAEKDAWDEATKAAYEAAEAAMQAYNLDAGKHLTITATLTTDRIVLITALLEDWEDISMTSICDDFGKQGDPIIIDSRKALSDFLTDPNKNKEGNIGLVTAPDLVLDTWESVSLNCMLNLAGNTLHCKGRVFNDLSATASLLNGTIDIVGDEEMMSAVCINNYGSIEQIHVSVKEDAQGYANKGGIVGTNYGTIFDCVCDLPVKGKTGYIGGIAGESKKAPNSSIVPIIDKCVMNAKVDGTDGVTGVGGIVGYAENRVSRCTFNYGMTLLQQTNEKFANIVQSTYEVKAEDPTEASDLVVDAYGNAWPTTYPNEIGRNASKNENVNASALYLAVIDSQAELQALLTMSHNTNGTDRYRIAGDFEVDGNWKLGLGDEDAEYKSDEAKYHLNFELDGNDKTITTHGKRLFSHINGYFHDMTIYCAEPIVVEGKEEGNDMASPFAFAVDNGGNLSNKATIERIKVKMNADYKDKDGNIVGAYIQSSQPAGLISRAFGGASIKDCEVSAVLKIVFPDSFTNEDSRRYAGGISACSTDATFSGCKVHSDTKIIQDGRAGLNHRFHFRGGIVGGILTEAGISPATVIEECYSWWNYTTGENISDDSPSGALIGAAKYAYLEDKNHMYLGLDKGEGIFGNWWLDNLRAAGDITNSEAEATLGRRNNVVPNEVLNF